MSALIDRLASLLNGKLKPMAVIGTGYKNPKKTASEYLRTQVANSTLSEQNKVSTVIVSTSGYAFKSESNAKRSKAYCQLSEGKCELFARKVITDFGVWPSAYGDGYEIYVCAK